MHRFHFDTMGTVASIATLEPVDATVQGALRACCEAFDRRFSLYRTDSELAAVNAGRLSLTSASTELREAYALAIAWRGATNGAFTPERPDGALDLNGVVKALAIRDSVALLRGSGISAGHVSIGGDGECWGEAAEPWRAGIIDPNNSQQLISTVTLVPGRAALATSGSAERGDHIWRQPGVTPLRQASVLAADIVTADVLATALVAGGAGLLDQLEAAQQVEAFLVTADGELLATPGWSDVHVEQ